MTAEMIARAGAFMKEGRQSVVRFGELEKKG
jgi:hypothetical protein